MQCRFQTNSFHGPPFDRERQGVEADPMGKIKRPAALWVLFGVLLFQGVSALAPGVMLIIDPSGALLGMTPTALQGGPFHDYLIPGIILAGALGLGPLLVAVGLVTLPDWPWLELLNACKRKEMHWSWLAAALLGAALMIWILVQVAIIGPGSWLQPFYFAVGLLILLLCFAPSVRAHLRFWRRHR